MNLQYHYLVIFLLMGLYQGVSLSQATSCTEIGRFPNDENNDCRGYIMCLKGGITNFTEYNITCPLGSIYSHIEQQCTNATNYQCHPNFNCTSIGNFVNPESKNCSSYFACVQGINNLATARLVECSENTVFNSEVNQCVDSKQDVCKTSNIIPDVVVQEPTFVNINISPSSNAALSNFVSYVIMIIVSMVSIML